MTRPQTFASPAVVDEERQLSEATLVAAKCDACIKSQPRRRRSGTDVARLLDYNYDGMGTSSSPLLVTWLPEDVENPMTFSALHRWSLVLYVSLASFAVTLASSAYSGAVHSIRQQLGGSDIVITLGLSLYVVGFAVGPLVWAPMSELLGRRRLFLFTFANFTLWTAVAAASPNLAALLVFRFLAGAFGSSTLTNSAGTLADVFPAKQRGLAMSLYSLTPFMGPALGPVFGGFISQQVGFRWVHGVLAIFAAAVLLAGVFVHAETYAPYLLRKRAATMQKCDKDQRIYQSVLHAEGKQNVSFLNQFATSLGRPWLLLAYEPIVLLLSLYTAVVYAIMYSFFTAFPIVFQDVRGWRPGVGGLAFMGIFVGMLLAIALIVVYINPNYIQIVDQHGGITAPPEMRLKSCMVGAPILVVSLAAFGASDGANVHWSASIILSAPFGFAVVLLYIGLINYLVDAYVIYAASVLAANNVIRSLLGAAFPLLAPFMYHPGGDVGKCLIATCGIHVGPAIAGGIALLFLPAPYFFYKRGQAIRKRCKYAAEADALLQKMLAKDGGDGKVEVA